VCVDGILNSEKEENPFLFVREDYTLFVAFTNNCSLYSNSRNNSSDTLM
jgi:hypothetical protein